MVLTFWQGTGGNVCDVTRIYQVVDVTGIENHQMTNLPIINARGLSKSQKEWGFGAETIWDPAVHDSIMTGDDNWYEAVADYANDDISYDTIYQFGQFRTHAVNSVLIAHITELIINELYTFTFWRLISNQKIHGYNPSSS